MSDKRILWIDTAKALAIFFIVFGHVLHGSSMFFLWTYRFHVPMFVIISGYVFSVNNYTYIEFFKKKFVSLMLPYYIFSLLSIVVYKLFVDKGELSILNCIYGMLWANGQNGDYMYMKWNLPMWYIPMIFVMENVAFFIIKRLKNDYELFFCFFVSVLIAYVIYSVKCLNNLPFSTETVIYLFPFLIFGKILRNANIGDVDKHIRLSIAFGSILVGSILAINEKNIDYVCDQYRDYLEFLLIGIILTYGIFMLLSIKENGIEIMNYIGKHTLAILMLHIFPRMFFMKYFPFVTVIYEKYTVTASLIISIVCIFICLLIAIPINLLFKKLFVKLKYKVGI